jgi:plasmid stabilization system protein ParE
MTAYVLTPLAKADIFNIWRYIADDNEDAADRVEQAIFHENAQTPITALLDAQVSGLSGRQRDALIQ